MSEQLKLRDSVRRHPDGIEVDISGYFDEARNIEYLSSAVHMADGSWRCLANVSGALCLVEVDIRTRAGLPLY